MRASSQGQKRNLSLPVPMRDKGQKRKMSLSLLRTKVGTKTENTYLSLRND